MQHDIVVDDRAKTFEQLNIKPIGLPEKMHSLLGLFRQGREYIETIEK
jgi:hypothetical protein